MYVMPQSTFWQAHGQTLSTMLPHVIEFNLSHGARVDKYALVAEAFGVADKHASDADNAKAAVEAWVRADAVEQRERGAEAAETSAAAAEEEVDRLPGTCAPERLFMMGEELRRRRST